MREVVRRDAELIAAWDTRGKDFLRLWRDNLRKNHYYTGNGCGGTLPACRDDVAAVAWMVGGPVKTLLADRPSLRRTY